jgi:hypothetical protein
MGYGRVVPLWRSGAQLGHSGRRDACGSGGGGRWGTGEQGRGGRAEQAARVVDDGHGTGAGTTAVAVSEDRTRGELLIRAVWQLGAVLVTYPPSTATVSIRAKLGYRKLYVLRVHPLTTRCPARRTSGNAGLTNANDVEARYLHLRSRQLRMDLSL